VIGYLDLSLTQGAKFLIAAPHREVMRPSDKLGRIATLTMNPAIDANTSVDQVVAERKLRCRCPSHEPGGGGINVSRAIKRLGGSSMAIYPVGGFYGKMLESFLDREGLDHRPITIEGITRENFIVYEGVSGRQFRFDAPGPTLHESEWKRCLKEVSQLDPAPDYVVASGSLPPGVPRDFYLRVARVTGEIGAKLIVDTSGEPLRLVSRAGVYLLKPNVRELGDLVGKPLRDESQLEESAMAIVEGGYADIVVCSLGVGGALLFSEDGYEHIRSPTVPIKSKVGAGDSMVAGIALFLAQGKPIRDAVRFGVAAGGAAVMTPGTELCRREDTERLYNLMGSEFR